MRCKIVYKFIDERFISGVDLFLWKVIINKLYDLMNIFRFAVILSFNCISYRRIIDIGQISMEYHLRFSHMEVMLCNICYFFHFSLHSFNFPSINYVFIYKKQSLISVKLLLIEFSFALTFLFLVYCILTMYK